MKGELKDSLYVPFKGGLQGSLYVPFKGAPKIFFQRVLKVAQKHEEKDIFDMTVQLRVYLKVHLGMQLIIYIKLHKNLPQTVNVSKIL